MSRRGSEVGSPSRKTAEAATGSTRKSRNSAGESSAHSQQQKPVKRTGKKDGKKKPPKTKLLNGEQLVDCVIEDVLKEVPDKLIGDLFPERKFFWLSLLPEKIQTLVHSAVLKYLTLYKECGQTKDRSAVLYMK